MGAKRIIRYKCPFCDKRMTREDLVNHVDEDHNEVIPEDFTPFRYVFNYVNNRPESYHGRCTECGGPTPWDEERGRYKRQCSNKKCHDSFVKRCESNNLRVLGVTRISATAGGQEKMLARRKISGEYRMSDGVKKTYTGSYEKKALEFMDKILHISSDDIQCPGPVLEYTLNKQKHMYITDFYYVPYNLIIEVKDGGDRPNMRNMPEYRAKQIAKERFIIEHTDYNYLRLTNNNLKQLLHVFMDLKMQMSLDNGSRVIHVNETMYASGYTPVVGYNDKASTLVVNYMQNRVFAGDDPNGYAIADKVDLKKIITRDKTGKLKETDGRKFLENTRYNIYMVETTNDALSTIKDNIGEFVEEGFLYETLFGKKMYTYDQIACEESAHLLEDYYYHMDNLRKSLYNFLTTGEGDIIEKFR